MPPVVPSPSATATWTVTGRALWVLVKVTVCVAAVPFGVYSHLSGCVAVPESALTDVVNASFSACVIVMVCVVVTPPSGAL